VPSRHDGDAEDDGVFAAPASRPITAPVSMSIGQEEYVPRSVKRRVPDAAGGGRLASTVPTALRAEFISLRRLYVSRLNLMMHHIGVSLMR
jgi:hypothetical protein